jgi:hypothetical protein
VLGAISEWLARLFLVVRSVMKGADVETLGKDMGALYRANFGGSEILEGNATRRNKVREVLIHRRRTLS